MKNFREKKFFRKNEKNEQKKVFFAHPVIFKTYSPFHAIGQKVWDACWCVAVRDPIRSGKLSNLERKASSSDPVAVELFLHDFHFSRFLLENFFQKHFSRGNFWRKSRFLYPKNSYIRLNIIKIEKSTTIGTFRKFAIWPQFFT